MTLLNYIQNMSQTHLAGHLSPKSRPATPLPTGPVTPLEPEPTPIAPIATEATPSESACAVDAFVDAPTEPIIAEPVNEPTPVVEPTSEPTPAPEPVVETIPEEQPVVAQPIELGAPVETSHHAEEVKETSLPVAEPEVAPVPEAKPLVEEVSLR